MHVYMYVYMWLEIWDVRVCVCVCVCIYIYNSKPNMDYKFAWFSSYSPLKITHLGEINRYHILIQVVSFDKFSFENSFTSINWN